LSSHTGSTDVSGFSARRRRRLVDAALSGLDVVLYRDGGASRPLSDDASLLSPRFLTVEVDDHAFAPLAIVEAYLEAAFVDQRKLYRGRPDCLGGALLGLWHIAIAPQTCRSILSRLPTASARLARSAPSRPAATTRAPQVARFMAAEVTFSTRAGRRFSAARRGRGVLFAWRIDEASLSSGRSEHDVRRRPSEARRGPILVATLHRRASRVESRVEL